MEIAYLIILCFCIFYFILHPIIDFWSWFQWWNQNKYIGNPNGYDCLNLVSMALWRNNFLLYYLWNLVDNGPTRFQNDAQVRFIYNLLITESTSVGGKMLPKDICDKLVPVQTFGIPWPTDEQGWKLLFMKWTGIDSSTVFKNTDDYKPDTKLWQQTPENFLFINWGIDANTPLIAGFITGLDSVEYNSTELIPRAIWPLLGLSSDVGGWLGFLENNSFDSIGHIENFIWSEISQQDHKRKLDIAKPKQNNCGPGLAAPIGNSIMAGAMLATMIPPPFGIIAGLVVGGTMAGASIASACT